MPSIPEEVARVLESVDSGQPCDEFMLAQKVIEAAGKLEGRDETERRTIAAIVSGLNFQRQRHANPWGIYWNCMSAWETKDGTPVYQPDVAAVSAQDIQVWRVLSGQIQHPELSARFADLAWEIGRFINKTRDDPTTKIELPVDLPRRAIDRNLEAVRMGVVDEYGAWQLLDRSAELAIELNDPERIIRTKRTAFAYLESARADGKKYQWWQFDNFVAQHANALDLSEEESKTIVEVLEGALERSCEISKPETFDPHDAVNAADRLARLRIRANNREQIEADLQRAGGAFEAAAQQASALVAIAWLEDLIPRYRRAGMIEDAVRVERAIRSRADQARSEMKRYEATVEIPPDELEALVANILGNSLQEALARIAVNFLQREKAVEASLHDMLKNAPLLSMMPTAMTGAGGFTVATVGSVRGDLLGRTIQHGAERLGWHAALLNLMFVRTMAKYSPSTDNVLGWLNDCPFFASSREPLLREGIDAWLKGDAVKAIHVLIPQIEAALRDVLESAGAPVVIYRPQIRGFEVVSMGGILDHAVFRSATLADIRFHLIALMADARGINLRNHVAHGIARLETFGMGMANWVIHATLVIGMLRPGATPPGGSTPETPTAGAAHNP